MQQNTPNLIRKYVIALFVLIFAVLPSANLAVAQTHDDACPISIAITVDPLTVSHWTDAVTITLTARRQYAFGYYCTSSDHFQLAWAVTPSNGQRIVLVPSQQFTFPEDTVGRNQEVTNSRAFQLSNYGLTNQGGAAFAVTGAVSRTTAVGTTVQELVSNIVGVSNTSNPNGNNNNNNNNNANANANSNANSGPPNNSLNNNAINTNISTTYALGLDDSLGIFFNPLTVGSVPELISSIVRILFLLISIAAVIIIIVSGFRMVMANGNEDQLTKAKKSITWAIVGLIVSLMSFSIVAIIQNLISRQ